MSYLPSFASLAPFNNVTGNFVVSGYGARYIWSGNTVTWTGTLGTPSTLSGAAMTVKNVSTGASLLLTGSVDYNINYTVTPFSAVTLWSTNDTWLLV